LRSRAAPEYEAIAALALPIRPHGRGKVPAISGMGQFE
jgi:hypothetical protein